MKPRSICRNDGPGEACGRLLDAIVAKYCPGGFVAIERARIPLPPASIRRPRRAGITERVVAAWDAGQRDLRQISKRCEVTLEYAWKVLHRNHRIESRRGGA